MAVRTTQIKISGGKILTAPLVIVSDEILEDMRSWVAECEWGEDLWEDDFDPWKESDDVILKGIQNHFDGGIKAFLATY